MRASSSLQRLQALVLSALLAGAAAAFAQPAAVVQEGGPPAAAQGEPVIAGGQVPDEATRAAVIDALRAVYGAANVVDRIEVDPAVATPPNWSVHAARLLTPQLREVRRGQLRIEGTQIQVTGEVGSEAARSRIVSGMAAALNPTYTIRNGLRVPASEQLVVDQALADRIVEFEVGSATLTARGRAILDELAPTLQGLANRSVAVIGHTDNAGSRAANLALSQARADSVKGYLVGKGIDPVTLATSGVGPDQPVASNETAEGRSRNRRIEFRVGRALR